MESNNKLPFLDVLVCRQADGRLSHTVFRKPTHSDLYLQVDSHHHPAHLSSIPRTLINRALRLCDLQFINSELGHIRNVLEANGYSWRQSLRLVGGKGRPKPVSVDRLPAYLPYIKGITDRIGSLLRQRYNIKTFFRPPAKLRQFLRSPKHHEPLNVPGVYMIPCDCGKCYIGETRRNVATRVSEHIRSIKNMDRRGSALAEHALDSGPAHFIRFDKTKVLAKEKYLVPRKVRESIEICRRPNYNRDSGWLISQAWKPLLYSPDYKELGVESDTISVVCTQPYVCEEDSNSADSDSDVVMTERDARALARSVRRAHRERVHS